MNHRPASAGRRRSTRAMAHWQGGCWSDGSTPGSGGLLGSRGALALWHANKSSRVVTCDRGHGTEFNRSRKRVCAEEFMQTRSQIMASGPRRLQSLFSIAKASRGDRRRKLHEAGRLQWPGHRGLKFRPRAQRRRRWEWRLQRTNEKALLAGTDNVAYECRRVRYSNEERTRQRTG